MDLFGSRYAIPTGLQHGTVTVLMGESENKQAIEVTTYRGEGVYLDGRRPDSVRFGVTLEQDLSRRDFTMNAIAWEPTENRIVDPFGGRSDLARRLVRAVGNPILRFTEDGLRPMRAVRQATQLGFTIDSAVLEAIPATLDSFKKVAPERLRDELGKLLTANSPSLGIEWLRQTSLLEIILPELSATVGCVQNRYHKDDVYRHILATLDAAMPDPIIRMAALLHDIGKPITQQPKEGCPGEFTFFGHERVGETMARQVCERLRLSAADRELIAFLVAGHMFFYTADWTDGAVRRFVAKIGVERLPYLFALREADVASRGTTESREVETRPLKDRIAQLKAAEAAFRVTDLAINGKDLMRELCIPPGKVVGKILGELLEMVLDNPALNQPEALLEIAQRLASKDLLKIG
jgi:putative nucleotidyltransferase with HDIG domain